MKKGHVLINWVLDDEELLEPYEWDEEDDLEILDDLPIIHVDEKTLYDLIYCTLQLKDMRFIEHQQTFLFSHGKYALAIEFDQEGRLIYRGTLLYEQRTQVNALALQLPVISLSYTIFDYGCMKEYGLTRLERLKKQLVEECIDGLYECDHDRLLKLYQEYFDKKEDNLDKAYHRLKEKIESGYSLIHELLYAQLIKYPG